MNLELDGDVAVVVGGGRGLGRAIAAAFCAEGASVVVVDRDPECASAVAALTPSKAASAVFQAADVTDLAAIERIADETHQSFGKCDHVVFAAAIGSGKFGFPFWNVHPSEWERVLRVNVVGAANVAHAFAPRMAEARRGTFLYLASVAGQIGSQTDPPYSASKAALINFAQCSAKDLAPYNVRVNTLCPGMVQTALNRSVYDSWAARQSEGEVPSYDVWAHDKIRTLVPLGRWQTPEDIAAMAVFLASSKAANITGQTVNVDGGYVMH